MKGRTIEDAAIVMSPADTVATALADLEAERTIPVDGGEVTIGEPIRFGHKFALCAHDDGEDVLKYGAVIGRTTRPIEAGEWVHTHNMTSIRGQPEEETE